MSNMQIVMWLIVAVVVAQASYFGLRRWIVSQTIKEMKHAQKLRRLNRRFDALLRDD